MTQREFKDYMTNNNDWKERFENEFPCMGVSDSTSNSVYRHDQFLDGENSEMIRFISQNFIPLSSLEKFIEENEKGDINPDTGLPYYSDYWKGERDGHNSALKLLKDKFIHE